MCGIGGFICNSVHEKSQAFSILEKMGKVIRHRGPDSHGNYFDESAGVGLLHERLKIIDLSDKANQPMRAYCKVLVYNGEIYNYKELKSELESAGYVFHTASDSEVLLAMYDKYGFLALDRLDGMFSFAIWDEVKRQLFCARDRFGEKPFFFLQTKDAFIFASEIKSILSAGLTGKIQFNKDALQFFLNDTTSYVGSATFFENIHKLLPGHYLIVQNGKIEQHSYYQPGNSPEIRYKSDQEYIDHFFNLFSHSVKVRLRSDVKIGTSLSGGIDSSSIVSFIAGELKESLATVSARFPGSPKDEGKWIKDVVNTYHLQNVEVEPAFNDMMDSMDRLMWHHEMPVASASVFAQWKVMQAASEQGIKVMLDGQGADEILAGYKPYRQFILWELYRNGKWKSFKHEKKIMKSIHPEMKSGFLFLTDPISIPLGLVRKELKQGKSLRERMMFDLQHNLCVLLDYADRNAMAHAVEVRLPFLHHPLVDFLYSIPVEYLFRNGTTKWILREALHYCLPETIYSRADKIGYEPPQEEWMKSPEFTDRATGAVSIIQLRGLSPARDTWKNVATASFLSTFFK